MRCPGIVDQNVDPLVPVERGLDNSPPIRVAAQIGRHRERVGQPIRQL